MTRTKRAGELEQLTLLAVWRLGEEAWAGSVREQLEGRAGRRITLSAVYLTLTRLESKGCVESRLDGAQPVRGGKAKRFFRITATGRETLLDAREQMRAMWEGLEPDGDREVAR